MTVVFTRLRVEMASNTCLISTGNGTFYLFTALTLADVVAEGRILLRGAIFTLSK